MSGGRRIIHVVDDDPSFRTAVSRLLQVAGYDVRGYASVAAFLEADPASVTGCVLADLRMPVEGGVELKRRLTDARNPVPVIIMTALGDVPATEEALREGALEVLTKPVAKDDLLAAAERAFAQGAAPPRGRPPR